MKEIINLLTIWFNYRINSESIAKHLKRIAIPTLMERVRSSNFHRTQMNNTLRKRSKLKTKSLNLTSWSRLISKRTSREALCSPSRILECITVIWIKSTDFRISPTQLPPPKCRSQCPYMMQWVSRIRRVIFVRVWILRKLMILSKW
jgi:hypothetical protein